MQKKNEFQKTKKNAPTIIRWSNPLWMMTSFHFSSVFSRVCSFWMSFTLSKPFKNKSFLHLFFIHSFFFSFKIEIKNENYGIKWRIQDFSFLFPRIPFSRFWSFFYLNLNTLQALIWHNFEWYYIRIQSVLAAKTEKSHRIFCYLCKRIQSKMNKQNSSVRMTERYAHKNNWICVLLCI